MSVRIDALNEHYNAPLGLGAQTACTVMGWFKPVVDRNDWSTVVGVDSGASTDILYAQSDATGTNLFFLDENNTADVAFNNGTAWAIGAWSHVALVQNGTQLTGYIQADGAGSPTTDTTTAAVSANINMAHLRIGESIFGGEWPNGELRCIRVWNAALSASEIAAERTSPTPVRTANLQASFGLANTTDTVDQSANGRTLTVRTATNGASDPASLVTAVPSLPPILIMAPRATTWR